MKLRWLLTLIIIAFGCTSGNAQKDPKIRGVRDSTRLYYDYNRKSLYIKNSNGNIELSQALPHKSGKTIKIEVINYNPLKTQLSFGDTSSSYFLADTATFSRYITLPAIPELQEGKSPGNEKLSDSTGETSYFTKANTKEPCTRLRAAMADLNVHTNAIEQSIQRYKALVGKIQGINDVYEILKNGYTLDPAEVKTALDGFITTINDDLPAEDRLAADANALNQTAISTLETRFAARVREQQALLDQTRRNFESVDGCKEIKALYSDFLENYYKATTAISNFSTERSNAYEAFRKNLALYQSLKTYLKPVPPFTSRAFITDADERKVTLFASDNGGAKYTVDDFTFYAVKGWKLDVSAGVFISGLSDHSFSRSTKDSIFQKQYLADGHVRDTTVMQTFTSITRQKQDNISFGGMIYLHAHSQNQGYLNFGVSIGFGALFNDQARWAGSIGPSLLIGRKQRLVITPAVIIGQVSRLSSEVAENTWYARAIDNVPTYRAWKLSWSCGISWNLK